MKIMTNSERYSAEREQAMRDAGRDMFIAMSDIAKKFGLSAAEEAFVVNEASAQLVRGAARSLVREERRVAGESTEQSEEQAVDPVLTDGLICQYCETPRTHRGWYGSSPVSLCTIHKIRHARDFDRVTKITQADVDNRKAEKVEET